jgi:hypothetical protein
MVPLMMPYAIHAGANAAVMGRHMYAAYPQPSVSAVEMAAYIIDLAVSFTKHSLGMAVITSPCRRDKGG